MKKSKQFLCVCVGACVVFGCFCEFLHAAEGNPPSSGRRKFGSSGSIMKKRKKDNSKFSKRKKFGQKQQKGRSAEQAATKLPMP